MTRPSSAPHILEDLFAVIESRKTADPKKSHTAALLAAGPGRAAKKVGEEAMEVVVAALSQSEEAVINESADLLYHLLVLWAARDVVPVDVWRALEARQGVSGIEEKRNRNLES